ncbi:MAG: hypothetical protein MHM6MM_005097 [Cercozoa sp. M6MM]
MTSLKARAESWAIPLDQDPLLFKSRRLHHSAWEVCKVIILLPLIVVRLVLILACFLSGIPPYLLLYLVPESKEEKTQDLPPRGFRKFCCDWYYRIACRVFLWCCGVQLKEFGKKEDAHIVVMNHGSVLDAFIGGAVLMPLYALSLEANFAIPGFGHALRLAKSISLTRGNGHEVQETIRRRAHSKEWQQANHCLLLYPEGTCTNGEALAKFQLGAFAPLVPVQPCVLQYPWVHHDPTWTFNRVNPGLVLLRILSQLYTQVEVHFLPVMTPVPKETPDAFAERVRQVMSHNLQNGLSEVTLRESLTRTYLKAGYPCQHINVLVERVKAAARIRSVRTVANLATLFSHLDRDHDGYLRFSELPDSLTKLFELPAAAKLIETHEFDTLTFSELCVLLEAVTEDEEAVRGLLQNEIARAKRPLGGKLKDA